MLGRWGLGSRNRSDPDVPPPHPCLREQASWARVGRAHYLLSSPAPPVWERPSRLSLVISPAPFYAPRTHAAWMGLWRGVTSLGAHQAPPPEWARRLPSAPFLLFSESPSRLPLLISLASGVLILSGLHAPPPMSYRFTLGFLPSAWASESPTSVRQVP